MTIFATQNSNLVFASPDGSNGTPDFRALTVNDVPTVGIKTSILTNIIVGSNTTEVYATPQFKIPANTAQAGDSFRINMGGRQAGAIQFPAVNYISPSQTFNLRVGANGNIADPIVLSVTCPADSPSINTPIQFFNHDFVITLRNTGNNANLWATSKSEWNVRANVTNSAFSVDTTQDLYLGASFASSVGEVSNRESQNNYIEIAIVEQIK